MAKYRRQFANPHTCLGEYPIMGNEIDASEQVARVFVLASPQAGSGANRSQVPALVDQARARGFDVTLTDSADRIASFVKECKEQDCRGVIVTAGGDGTLSLGARRLMEATQCDDSSAFCDSEFSTKSSHGFRRNRVAIMPMPLGTENLVARYYGHRCHAESIVETIIRGTPQQLDLGVCQRISGKPNGRRHDAPFFAMATCGFDAEVIRDLHFNRSGHISKTTYLKHIARVMRRYRFPKIKVRIPNEYSQEDDACTTNKSDASETIECCWAMVFNLPCYAFELGIEPEARGDDGLLDLITFRGGSILSGLKYVSAIRSGRHLKHPDVTRRRVSSVQFESEYRVPIQIDGDYNGRLPATFSIRKQAVTTLVPAKF